jgi:hypothetical protein
MAWPRNRRLPECSLKRAANLREHIVGVGPDEVNRAHGNHQDDREHNRVLSDVLSLFIQPEFAPHSGHGCLLRYQCATEVDALGMAPMWEAPK